MKLSSPQTPVQTNTAASEEPHQTSASLGRSRRRSTCTCAYYRELRLCCQSVTNPPQDCNNRRYDEHDYNGSFEHGSTLLGKWEVLIIARSPVAIRPSANAAAPSIALATLRSSSHPSRLIFR